MFLRLARGFWRISPLGFANGSDCNEQTPYLFDLCAFFEFMFSFLCLSASDNVKTVLWLSSLWGPVPHLRLRWRSLFESISEIVWLVWLGGVTTPASTFGILNGGWYVVFKKCCWSLCKALCFCSIQFMWRFTCGGIGVISDWPPATCHVKMSINQSDPVKPSYIPLQQRVYLCMLDNVTNDFFDQIRLRVFTPSLLASHPTCRAWTSLSSAIPVNTGSLRWMSTSPVQPRSGFVFPSR